MMNIFKAIKRFFTLSAEEIRAERALADADRLRDKALQMRPSSITVALEQEMQIKRDFADMRAYCAAPYDAQQDPRPEPARPERKVVSTDELRDNLARIFHALSIPIKDEGGVSKTEQALLKIRQLKDRKVITATGESQARGSFTLIVRALGLADGSYQCNLDDTADVLEEIRRLREVESICVQMGHDHQAIVDGLKEQLASVSAERDTFKNFKDRACAAFHGVFKEMNMLSDGRFDLYDVPALLVEIRNLKHRAEQTNTLTDVTKDTPASKYTLDDAREMLAAALGNNGHPNSANTVRDESNGTWETVVKTVHDALTLGEGTTAFMQPGYAAMVEALTKIAKWFGEFPAVRSADGTETSYAVAYGSNGERDYMRRVAEQALKITTSDGESLYVHLPYTNNIDASTRVVVRDVLTEINKARANWPLIKDHV